MDHTYPRFLRLLQAAGSAAGLLPALAMAVALLLSSTAGSWADGGEAAEPRPADDLVALSIQDLMNIEVTSVSKKAERLADAAAAVFVITQEDIRRSGVTSIPEALRMAPGLEVARIDSNKWAITSRGFNGRFARNMLVLFDGRTVYTPLFSGVFWDRQDTLLEDIDRIEVIRGPGATLWGANAVNGVINIITRHGEETLGGLVSAGGGDRERGFGGVRYGFRPGGKTYMRIYGKYQDRNSFTDSGGREATDSWHTVRGGFRLDSEVTAGDSITIQGDMDDSRLGETYLFPLLVPPYQETLNSRSSKFGANILSRWKHTVSDSSDLSLQFYYDRSDQRFAVINEKRDTIDLDFQHRFALGERQEVIWGLGYRFTHDNIDNTRIVILSPERRDLNLFSAFLQDEVTLVADRLRLTLGAKYEHNDLTGSEVQPNARLLWTPHEGHTAWAAVSRAVRTPSRTEMGFLFNSQTIPPASPLNPGPVPVLVRIEGTGGLRSEELIAYEAGYRVKPRHDLSMDIAAFYNVYHRLVAPSSTGRQTFQPFPSPHLDNTFTLANNQDAETYGVELATEWAPLDWWRFHGAYTYLGLRIRSHEAGQDTGAVAGQNPRNQFSLRSQTDLGRNVDLDLWLRYVSSLASFGIGSNVDLDIRLGWRPIKGLELSLVGQNLFHDSRPEFRPEFINTVPTGTGRSFYGKVTWSF